jgi:uncharacterized membrane protein
MTFKGEVYLRAAMQRTGKCSDGMSDESYTFEFVGVGTPGPLKGCCRLKQAGT